MIYKDLNYLKTHFDEEITNFSIPEFNKIDKTLPLSIKPISILGAAVGCIWKSKNKTKYEPITISIPNSDSSTPQFKDEKDVFYKSIIKFCNNKKIDEIELYKKAQLSRSIFSKIRNMDKTNYIPSKVTVICICLALNLTLNETQEMLNYIGYSLSNKLITDKIIAWCIEHSSFNIIEIDTFIYDRIGKGYLLE